MARKLLLLEVSDNTIRQETQRVGQRCQAQEQRWQEESQEPAYLNDRHRQAQAPRRMYGSIDGVKVPVEGGWRELRAGCWYEVTALSRRQWPSRYKQCLGQLEGLKAEKIGYYCVFTEWRTFADLAWATGCRRGADVVDELVFVADGARWIWESVELPYPEAVQIVDWYHAITYLTPIADVLYADELEAQAWRERMCTKLWESEIEEVIATCQALLDHAQAGEPARKAVTYYQNNKQRMDYARYRREGYFIGSGTIESACKQLATMRLKRSGARWTEEGALKRLRSGRPGSAMPGTRSHTPGQTCPSPPNNILVLPNATPSSASTSTMIWLPPVSVRHVPADLSVSYGPFAPKTPRFACGHPLQGKRVIAPFGRFSALFAKQVLRSFARPNDGQDSMLPASRERATRLCIL
jgi:hypothetical protein